MGTNQGTSQPTIRKNELALEAAGTLLLAAGAAWLLKTNPAGGRWEQVYDPLGRWQLSTLVAALPVILLLGAMAVVRMKAHKAALLGLAAALVVAMAVFHMPLRLALTTTAYGAGYGIFPVCWIIIPVIFLYQLTVRTGRFETLKKSLSNITDDGRLQLLLIAFGLGAFLEGAGGFGAPVAVCGAILISLGFRPLQAAGLCLIANTAPVAFGSLGIPVVAMQAVTGIPMLALSRVMGLILVPFCMMLPFWLVWAFAGFAAMAEVWPAIAVAAVPFTVVQYVMAAHMGPQLVDIAASMSTIVALIAFLRFWQPKRTVNALGERANGQARVMHTMSAGSTFKAWLPWLTLSALIFAWGIPGFQQWADKASISFNVVGLHDVVMRVPPVVSKATAETAVFNLNWLAATGTGILVAAVLAGLLMGVKPGTQVRVFGETLVSLRFTIMTIAGMMALGFVMRYCGVDATLGLAFARTGALYPFFGTLIGWLGTATTGSDTSSNVVFGSLQTMTAGQIGVSPVLMASANSCGGVMGKMIAAPSIVVASTATDTYGQEGTILRYVFWHSLALAALAGIFVYLLAYVEPVKQLLATSF